MRLSTLPSTSIVYSDMLVRYVLMPLSSSISEARLDASSRHQSCSGTLHVKRSVPVPAISKMVQAGRVDVLVCGAAAGLRASVHVSRCDERADEGSWGLYLQSLCIGSFKMPVRCLSRTYRALVVTPRHLGS